MSDDNTTSDPLPWHLSRWVVFSLRRRSGYQSPYSLGMVYPSWRQGLRYRTTKGGYLAPITVSLFGTRPRTIPPSLARLPSWIARVARSTDARGFTINRRT